MAELEARFCQIGEYAAWEARRHRETSLVIGSQYLAVVMLGERIRRYEAVQFPVTVIENSPLESGAHELSLDMYMLNNPARPMVGKAMMFDGYTTLQHTSGLPLRSGANPLALGFFREVSDVDTALEELLESRM